MSAGSTEVTNPAAFKQGSLGKQIGLTVVTFGLYSVYWIYDMCGQLSSGTDADINPTLMTVLFLIPIVNLYAIWKFSNAAAVVTDQTGVVLFILFLVFAPAAWFLIQSGANDVAG